MFFIQSYDVETECLFEYPIFLNILFSLNGMSQISLDNKLFLCGSALNKEEKKGTGLPRNTIEKEKNESHEKSKDFSSSFMYSINLLKTPITLKFEVNSCFLHYYPTLSILRNEYIIVLGGYKSKKCEYYSNTNKKWKELPDLPEERYGSTSICDNAYNTIYCFGGYNSQTKKNCMSIFKLNVNSGIKWETLIIMENSEYLAKYFSCLIKKDNGHCLILGGKNNKGQSTDEVIDLDVKNRRIIVTVQKSPALCNYLYFKNLRLGAENNNGVCYLFDDEVDDSVYRIDANFSSTIKINKP